MPAFGSGAGSDTERRHHGLASEVGKQDMIPIGHDRMRNASFGTFSRSPFKLSEILALDGDLGPANAVVAPIGQGLLRVAVETLEQSVGVGVAGLGTEFAGRHFEVCADQRVDVELFFTELFRCVYCLGQCGLTVLVNARYS